MSKETTRRNPGFEGMDAKRAGLSVDRPSDLADWIRENSYALAMAAVGAFDMAPEGSGVDLSLGAAGNAIVAMVEGERDPLAAVQKALNGRLWKSNGHWLTRWQAAGSESKVIASEQA